MGGWVLPHITPVSWVGLTATKQPIGIGAGLQVQGHTPLTAARSSPLVGPTLAWPHASLPPASLLQLPTSVITPHPVSAFIHHRRIAPVPSLIKKLRTLQVLLYRPFVLLHALLLSTSRCGVVRNVLLPVHAGNNISTEARSHHRRARLPAPCVFSCALARVNTPVSRIFPCSSLAPSTAVHPDSSF